MYTITRSVAMSWQHLRRALPVLLFLLAAGSGTLRAQDYSNFNNALVIPDTLSTWPLGVHSTIHLDVVDDSLVLFPGASPTNPVMAPHPFNPADTMPIGTMCYENASTSQLHILAPTLIWWKGDSVTMEVKNNLMMETTTHWHGAHVAPYNDGGPHQIIDMGSTWSPTFTIRDEAATMWYHPHLHHHTEEQVAMGMAGIIIVKDPADTVQSLLPHTYGQDDFPIILQDKTIGFDSISGRDTIDTFCSMGTIQLVNGTWKPVVNVPQNNIRFRILNGSSERTMVLSLQSSTTATDLVPFQVIASDKGYINAPYSMNTTMPPSADLDSILVIMPGERYEIVFDAAPYPGQDLWLMNRPDWLQGDSWLASHPGGPSLKVPACYKNSPRPPMYDSVPSPLLRVTVDTTSLPPFGIVPAVLANWSVPDDTTADKIRVKELSFDASLLPNSPFIIDNELFAMDTINDTVCLGATERWQVVNLSGGAHPFHMHDIHFFITRIMTIDTAGDTSNVHVPLYMKGPKDVVPAVGDTLLVVPPVPNVYLRTIHEFITTFDHFGTPSSTPDLADYCYMYHCHILGHEDGGMMHQFVVVNDCGVVSTLGGVSPVDWKLYPNPTDGQLTMQGPASYSGSMLTLLDSKGQEMRQWQLTAFKGDLSLDLGNIPSGVYLLKWSRPEGVSTKRISVVH